MALNFLDKHKEERVNNLILKLLLIVFTAFGLIGSVFLSPAKVLAGFIGLFVIIFSFFRPRMILAGLLFYLPFESFILKWLEDDIYIYARFFSEIVIYILCAVVLWRLLSGAIKWKSSLLDLPIAIFFIAIGISSLVNLQDPMITILGIRQIIRFILLYFVTVQLAPSRDWMKMVFKGMMAIVAVQVVLGFGQFFFGQTLDPFLLPDERRTLGEIEITAGTDYFWSPGERVFGTLGRYDRLGVFMAFFLIILTALIYEKRKDLRVVELGLLFLAFAVPVLALTYSRSSWFGFLLGILALAVLLYKDRRLPAMLMFVAVAFAAYAGFSGLVVSDLIDVPGQGLIERFYEAFSIERWTGEYFGLGRLYWIVQTVITVVPAALLFGHGPASYGGGAAAALQNTRVYDELALPFGVYGTEGMIDNNWMSLWGELGTLGLVIYLWVYLGLMIYFYRQFFRTESSFVRIACAGALGVFTAVALNAFLATFFEIRTLGPYLWVLAGLVVTLVESEKSYENS